MMSLIPFIPLAALLFFIPMAFADISTFSGESHGNEIILSFSDGTVSGILTLQNETINLDGIKVIEKNNKMYIFDNQNDLKILAKQIGSEKYLLIVKHSDERLRFLISMDSTVKKNTGQRDLFSALEEKEKQQQEKDKSDLTFRDTQIAKKNNQIAKSQEQFERDLATSTCKNKDGTKCLTSSKILENFEKAKITNSNNPVYDTPAISRNDGKKSFLIGVKLDQINSIILQDKYDQSPIIYEVRNGQPIVGAKVTVEISRDDYVLSKSEYVSGLGGKIRVEIDDIKYPLFYPKLCYDVKYVVQYNNVTTTWDDDFTIKHKDKIWNPDMSWTGESRWNYLPLDFFKEPRPTVLADKQCNWKNIIR